MWPRYYINASSGDTSVKSTTGSKVALAVDSNQNVVMSSSTIANPASKLTVSEATGQCVQLINDSTGASSSLIVNSDGGLVM